MDLPPMIASTTLLRQLEGGKRIAFGRLLPEMLDFLHEERKRDPNLNGAHSRSIIGDNEYEVTLQVLKEVASEYERAGPPPVATLDSLPNMMRAAIELLAEHPQEKRIETQFWLHKRLFLFVLTLLGKAGDVNLSQPG